MEYLYLYGNHCPCTNTCRECMSCSPTYHSIIGAVGSICWVLLRCLDNRIGRWRGKPKSTTQYHNQDIQTIRRARQHHHDVLGVDKVYLLGTQVPLQFLYTRIGSNRGTPQSTIMYRIQNIHTHSNVKTEPSGPAPILINCGATMICGPAVQFKSTTTL